VGAVATPLPATAYCFAHQSVMSGLETLAVVGAHHLPVVEDDPPHGRLLGVLAQEELLGLTRELRAARAAAAGPVHRWSSSGRSDSSGGQDQRSIVDPVVTPETEAWGRGAFVASSDVGSAAGTLRRSPAASLSPPTAGWTELK
jgi:hypothetical protein